MNISIERPTFRDFNFGKCVKLFEQLKKLKIAAEEIILLVNTSVLYQATHTNCANKYFCSVLADCDIFNLYCYSASFLTYNNSLCLPIEMFYKHIVDINVICTVVLYISYIS